MKDAKGAERQVFQTAGLLSYDVCTQRFTWVSNGLRGYLGVTAATVSDTSFVWSMADRGNLRSRFTITRPPEGEWYEVGEESSDGVVWARTIEMRLTKH